jgi:catechol 2,3-dioxygenase-like lactoylglutathione lyase family enzyme
MDMKLEVIGIPVSDVDIAKEFYVDKVGFVLDHDVNPAPNMRVVQMTPPGSACSIVIGEGMPLGEPGTTRGPQLVVEDIDTVRSDLSGRGVPISDVQQLGPEGAPGSRFAFFTDPDGNSWSVQELKRS